ncbi:MAG: TetR/AcrR family transcriptional regulator [Chloroflexi bacterium]|nr:TetR/AcrR family transcriptional regulator [Chloroflexota bacterium]
MSPKVSEQHLEERRDQIMDAAVRRFSRHGFHQTTMDEICAEAEMSKGALYRYFSSKEDIVAAMYERSINQESVMMNEVLEQDGPVAALVSLSEGVYAKLSDPAARDGYRLAVQLWAEAMTNPRIYELQMQEFELWGPVIAGIIEEGQRRGEINGDLNPELVPRVIGGMFMGIVLQKSWDAGVDVDACCRIVSALLAGDFSRAVPIGLGTRKRGSAKT